AYWRRADEDSRPGRTGGEAGGCRADLSQPARVGPAGKSSRTSPLSQKQRRPATPCGSEFIRELLGAWLGSSPAPKSSRMNSLPQTVGSAGSLLDRGPIR